MVPYVYHVRTYVRTYTYVPLARRYIAEWAGRGMRREGGERRVSPVPVPARRNLSSAVHYWNAAATILYLRDALLVQLPTGELAEEGGGVAEG